MNINDEVLVRLTEDGERLWAAHWNRFNDNGGNVPAAIQKSARLADGRVCFQLHALMNIFGPACYNGSNKLPFVQNEVEIP